MTGGVGKVGWHWLLLCMDRIRGKGYGMGKGGVLSSHPPTTLFTPNGDVKKMYNLVQV